MRALARDAVLRKSGSALPLGQEPGGDRAEVEQGVQAGARHHSLVADGLPIGRGVPLDARDGRGSGVAPEVEQEPGIGGADRLQVGDVGRYPFAAVTTCARPRHDPSQPRAWAANRLWSAVPDLLLRIGHEAELREELHVLRHVGAGGMEASHVVLRSLLDQGAQQRKADLRRHRRVIGVQLDDHPVVAAWLLDRPAAADQLPIRLCNEMHRRRAARQPGRHEGGQADLRAGGRWSRHAQRAPIPFGGEVDPAR